MRKRHYIKAGEFSGSEVAEMFNTTRITVHRWVKKRKIGHIVEQVGTQKRVIFTLDHIKEFAKKHCLTARGIN